MKLKDQVCSLELAKRLKELGVKQRSYFWWVELSHELVTTQTAVISGIEEERCELRDIGVKRICSAFTVAELGEMLPLYLEIDANKGISFSVETCGLQIWKTYDNKGWVVAYGNRITSDDTEANARAKMLVYLLENDLIIKKEK